MRYAHDDSADKIAVLAGLIPAAQLGNKMETSDSVQSQEDYVSDMNVSFASLAIPVPRT